MVVDIDLFSKKMSGYGSGYVYLLGRDITALYQFFLARQFL